MAARCSSFALGCLRRGRTLLLPGLAWLLVAAGAAEATPTEPLGDTELLFFGEETVETVSRSAEPLRSAPSSAVVITRAQLRERGFETLAELLSALPGFVVTHDGHASHVYSRGLRDSLLLMVDGVPIISDADRTELLLDERLTLADVARVEVVRGPVSALWGPGAATGVVNLVTIDDRELIGARAELGVGEPAQRLARGQIAGALGPVGWLVSASGRSLARASLPVADAPTRFVATPQGWLPGAWGEGRGEEQRGRFVHTLARLRWRRAWLGASYDQHDDAAALSGLSHALFPAGAAERRSGRELGLRTGAQADWEPLRLRAAGFFRRQERADDLGIFPSVAPHPAGGSIHLDSTFWHAGGWLQAELDRGPHRITLGVQGHYNDTGVRSELLDAVDGAATPGVRRDASSVVLSSFAQYRLTPRLSVPLHGTLGLSLDSHSDFALSLNPRAALVARPIEWLWVKVLYGEALRTPNQFDLPRLAGASFLGRLDAATVNPDLRPEKVRTGELSLRAEAWRSALEATLYVSRAEDLIRARRSEGVVEATNVGGRHILGSEAWLRSEPHRTLALRLGGALVRAWDLNGAAAHDMPERSLHAGLRWRPRAWLLLDLHGLHVAPRGPAPELGAYGLLHGLLRFGRGPVQLSLRVRNLLDVRFHDQAAPATIAERPLYVPGEPRTLLLLLSGAL